ncbi:MAG TPA: hypothetical protein VMU83_06925 [Hanamia sp.]|nr:hypothetical protein [Hanamia sp.]
MKLFYLLVPALFASSLLSAQQKYFVKGKIVTNAGDTISGFIERLGDKVLSDGITFKKEVNSRETQRFTPESLSGFILTHENRVYEPVSYEETKDGATIHEKKFANLLLKGYCSLYILYLKNADIHIIYEPENDHIFLAKKSDTVTVLKESESIVNNIYRLDKSYLDIMGNLFNDCSSIDSATIAQTGFSSKDMVSIFMKYNLCRRPGLEPATFKTKENERITSTIYGGYAFTVFRTTRPNPGITLGLFFSFIHPRVSERLAFSVGINYKDFTYVEFDTTENINKNYNLNLLGFPIKATYYFTNGKIAPFIEFGVIPTKVFNNEKLGVLKDVDVLGSAGPGVYIGHFYFSALIELSGIFTIRDGSEFSFSAGFRF